MAGVRVGLLQIDVLAGKELKNKDWFSENDPYVTLKLKGGLGAGGAGQANNSGGREVTVRTKTLHDGGQNPKWNDEQHIFQVEPKPGLTLDVEVLDYDNDGTSDSIGKTVLALDSVFMRPSGERTVKWYDIFSRKSGKVHGAIQLGVMWVNTTGSEKPPPQQPQQPTMPSAPPPQPLQQPTYVPSAPPPTSDQVRGWYYVDPTGATQGPYTAVEMRGWSSFFAKTTQVMAPGVTQWLPLSSYPQIGGKPPAPVRPPAPVQPQSSAGTLLQVTCPPGVYQGQMIYTRSPTGVQLAVTVPPGVTPGMVFHVRC